MRVGAVTLRLDGLLVAVGSDTDEGEAVLRSAFGQWIDDTETAVAPSFDLLVGGTSAERGVHPVPQLRRGASTVARSRSSGGVVAALDSVLGGIRAHRADPARAWTFLRLFAAGRRVVLVDARAPMLVNDPWLERKGIIEVPSWAVAVAISANGAAATVEVPPALTHTGAGNRYELLGMVVVDDTCGVDGPGAVLTRYGSRHTSADWFRTIAGLLDADRLSMAPDRSATRRAIARLLDVPARLTPGVSVPSGGDGHR